MGQVAFAVPRLGIVRYILVWGRQMGVSRPDAAGLPADAGELEFDFAAIGQTITKRFADSAARAGDAVAVTDGERRCSYRDLDVASNRLARLLKRRGIGVGSLVALRMGRSLDTIVAILAVLKTGGSYLPLDPTAPASYVETILHDSAADLVLDAMQASFDVPTLALHDAVRCALSESAEPLDSSCAPSDIAYVMYTSGSTGQPKGVLVPHRGVVRLVVGQEYVRLGPDEVMLHAAPLAFDASTFEIWGALLNGGELVVLPDQRMPIRAIGDLVRARGITTAWFTAGLFHALVDQGIEQLRGIRQILAGGDVLSPTHVARAQSALPDCQFVNGYGPTENTTFTCCYRIPAGAGDGSIPIGTPIKGTYVRLLDDAMRPAAEGEVAMLYAGGLGLASGYLGDAQHAGTQFVPDPLHAGATLYRTGDLVRRRADGQIEFVGRRDRQVKIDGKRVEPGEIEEALRAIPGVADAAVRPVPVARSSGPALLVAYLKRQGASADEADLVAQARDRLSTTLPAHMRPARFMVLDSFPLTANGKVDIANLPLPGEIVSGSPDAAGSDVEKRLAEIFSRILGIRGIGANTNFFDLGATSLKLLEAHAEIARTWPDIDVVALFKHPNIRALARDIDGRRPAHQSIASDRARRQTDALKRLRTARSSR